MIQTVNGVEHKVAQTGPSAALFVSNGNASFYQCNFASYQDTMYVGQPAKAFFYGGEIPGATDYVSDSRESHFKPMLMVYRSTGMVLLISKVSLLRIEGTVEVSSLGKVQVSLCLISLHPS